MAERMNVVLFGESGSGKSSTINLLLGSEVAAASDRAIGCTFKFQMHEAVGYKYYDTVGLSEGQKGTMQQSSAVIQLISLLKSLEDGVSLLVFVMEKGRIKKSLEENYKLFVDAICMNHVPVVLVITHCEQEAKPGVWWTENKEYFDRYGMKFNAVVSGCTMDPASAPPIMNKEMITALNADTLGMLRETIKNTVLIPGWKVKGGWKTWLQTILVKVLNTICKFFGFSLPAALQWLGGGDYEPSFQERLFKYFRGLGYDLELARTMSNEIANSV